MNRHIVKITLSLFSQVDKGSKVDKTVNPLKSTAIVSSSMFRYVDDVISRIGRMFPDMTIELFRPNGTSAVLLVITHIQNAVKVCSDQVTGGYLCHLPLSQVTLGKVLKAIVVMRSLFIDRTVVRGFNENVYNEDGKVSSHLTGNV